MPSGRSISTGKGAKNTDKLHILAEFTHFQRHTTFTMDGADYKNKIVHEGVRVLVAVRA